MAAPHKMALLLLPAPRKMRLLLLPLLLAQLAAAADPSCAHGIANSGEGACCAKSCGRCGGKSCSSLPGGKESCCGGEIAKSGRSCAEHDAPCALKGGGGGNCTLQVGIEFLGDDIAPPTPAKDLAACCSSCAADSACKFFTYEGGENALCHHKNTNAPDYSRHNASCTSGFPGVDPPTPPVPPQVDVAIGGLASQGGPNHVCWNIDASANRGFFWRNLSAVVPHSEGWQLAYQAAAIGEAQTAGFSLLRFGGSGNDYLTYAFGGTPCPPQSEYKQCLNETVWRDLLSFVGAAKAKMVFGLSMNTGEDLHSSDQRRMEEDSRPSAYPFPWDPNNARAILQWTIDHQLDHLIYGFELGNEQNTKYTGAQQATNFAILHKLTVELWPDESRRPLLFGPDPHSLHGPTGVQFGWIADWLDACKAKGVPVHAVTHHQYTEVDPSAAGFTSASKLALSSGIAAAINKTVREHSPTAKIFGGEIGPHNGGSPPCDHTSMRWATFGDSFWYADNLAAMAKNGYSGLCRQDYIGADYGLVDCKSGVPLPDYYVALLWAKLMGPKALSATATAGGGGQPLPAESSAIRIYAHCTTKTSGNSVTILAVNLDNSSTMLSFNNSLLGADDRTRPPLLPVEEYVLTPSEDAGSSLSGVAGLMGTGALLNGKPLALGADGSLPQLTPRGTSTLYGVAVPPRSVGFYVLDTSRHPLAACEGSE